MRNAREVFLPLILAIVAAMAAVAGAAESAVTVDLEKPGATISPYIYGQFIEHLGRCIRDGIWAEKLRDRKFLLTPDKSPWKPVRAEGAVCDIFCDPAGAYAGDHCMAVWVRENGQGACGLRQEGIGLLEGKEYVGYAILAMPDDSRATVEVRLAWGSGSDAGQSFTIEGVGRDYRKRAFRFRAGSTTENAALEVRLLKPGYVWIACLSLMPADNVGGMRADTLALVKRLNPPITRWPGGNFVSGYEWKDGIGDRDRRPPRWERAWNDVEDNDFGVDEFLAFCSEVGTEPYIAVNTGLGSVRDAADEVEYVTGARSTTWGRRRAQNGHPDPYPVTWWGAGNEMFGDWQLGHIPVERYAVRQNIFATAMKERNSNIRVIGVGAPGPWNDVVLPACAASMDLLSGHHYSERKLRTPFSPADADTYERTFAGYSGDVAQGVRRLVSDFRGRLGKGNAAVDRVRLAIDEWGIVRDWNAAPDAPGLGSFEHYYTLGDAIAAGRALHELIRSCDVVAMANWAQTVNVIGAVKTSRNHAVLDPVGHVLALYRAQVGGVSLPVTMEGDAPVDAVAARDDNTGAVTLGLINFSPSQTVPIRVQIKNAVKATGAWRITASHLTAINVPGQTEAVTTSELPDVGRPGGQIELPPHSITVVRFGQPHGA